MRILPPEELSFGVRDMAESARFCDDFGFTLIDENAQGRIYETLDGSRIVVRSIDDPALPPAMESGSTLRQMVFGVPDAAALEAVREELARDRVVVESDGRVISTDDAGLGIAFQLTRKRAVVTTPTAINAPGNFQRAVNARVDWDKKATPVGIGHVVLNCSDEAKARAFYIERLGCIVSDSFTGQGAFFRTTLQREHHCIFTVQRPPTGLNHVAFYVTDFHELMLGGKAMNKQGWNTRWGPGRHKLGSNYFWYMECPLGGAFEYTCDVDHVDENWVPGEFPLTPEMTAIWSARDFIPH